MGRRSRAKGVYRGRKGKPVAASAPVDDDPVYDEVDHFMKGSDVVPFGDSDSEGADQYNVTDMKHHVMQLSKDRELSESSDDFDSDSSDDEEQIQNEKKREKRLDDKYEEWGRLAGRNKYHGSDVQTNRETYESAIQEEEEARYLQEKQAENLTAGDFAVEGEDESDSDDDEFWDEAEQKKNFQQAAKAIEGVSLIPETKEEQKKKAKKVSLNLSKEEKLEIIEKDSPELLGLLKDFEGKLSELKNNIQPLLTEVVKNELPTSDGISFLEAKFHLLLNYCMNIGFYMLLKANGQQVQDHPVISQLVKLRLLLDKVKPIDQKLHYQIQKLLKMSADGGMQEQVAEGLQHRPNLESLDDDEMDEEKPGIYKVKKIAPVSYSEDPETKKKKRKVKTDTAMAAFVREEFSEVPQEINFSGRPKLTKEQQTEIEFEEEHFMRLTKQAKARKKQEKALLQRSELEDPLDFRDITGFGQFSDEEENEPSRNRLSEIIHSAEKNTSTSANPEIDIPYTSWERKQQLSKRSFTDFQDDNAKSDSGSDDLGPMNDGDDDDESIQSDSDEYIEQVVKKRKLEESEEEEDEPRYRDDTIEEGQKRGIPFQIRKNKGLIKQRAKKYKNSRVRYKQKAIAANKKLTSTGVKKVQSQGAPYAGELTGIRGGIVRSRRL